MNSKEIRKIIEDNNIRDLRSLLSFLGFPEIEYQVYWLAIIEETNERLYIEDCEYFFSSYLEYGQYKELEEFEFNYYDVDLELYQFYYYDKEKNALYYYCFRDDDPSMITKADLSEGEYLTFEEITEDFYASNDSDDEEYGTDEDFDTHANDVANGYGYYDSNGKYVSYGPNAI